MVENRRRTTKQRLAIRALFDDEPFFLTAQQATQPRRSGWSGNRLSELADDG